MEIIELASKWAFHLWTASWWANVFLINQRLIWDLVCSLSFYSSLLWNRCGRTSAWKTPCLKTSSFEAYWCEPTSATSGGFLCHSPSPILSLSCVLASRLDSLQKADSSPSSGTLLAVLLWRRMASAQLVTVTPVDVFCVKDLFPFPAFPYCLCLKVELQPVTELLKSNCCTQISL
jgi:hypothetical protein